jgi:DNA-directed RNA polymerase subunit A'
MECTAHMGHIDMPNGIAVSARGEEIKVPILIYNTKLLPTILDLSRIICHSCHTIRVDPAKLIAAGLVSDSAAIRYSSSRRCPGSGTSTPQVSVRSDGSVSADGDDAPDLDAAGDLETKASGEDVDVNHADGSEELESIETHSELEESVGVVNGRLRAIAKFCMDLTRAGTTGFMCMRDKCRAGTTACLPAGIQAGTTAVISAESKTGRRVDPKIASKASETMKRVMLNVGGKLRTMPIYDVKCMFDNIPKDEVALLGFADSDGPSRLILDAIPVLPPRLRPTIEVGGVATPAHMSRIYQKIVELVNNMNAARYPLDVLNFVKPNADFERQYNELVSWFHGSQDNSHKDIKLDTSRENEIKTLSSWIKGKHGYVRWALLGKRSAWSARLVIIHVPGLDFDEIAIPDYVARELPVKMVVTGANYDEIKALAAEGKIVFIRPREFVTKRMMAILPFTEEMKSKGIVLGDEVWRELRNGDKVMGNRQPTIHKPSIMTYRARVVKGIRGIGINMPVTIYHNADFDGDEMNIHVPMSDDAAEELDIASPINYIINEETNVPGIALTNNAIVSGLLLTQTRTIVPDDVYSSIYNLVAELPSYTGITLSEEKRTQPSAKTERGVTDLTNLTKRLADLKVEAKSGFGVFSMLLPEGFYYERGPVKIINGVIISGPVTKEDLGQVSGNIIQRLYMSANGREKATIFINRADKLLNMYIEGVGFTLSLEHCLPHPAIKAEFEEKKRERIVRARTEIDRILSMPPAKTEHEAKRREALIVEHADVVSSVGMSIIELMKEKGVSTPMTQMITSGARSDPAGLAQIQSMLGQAYLRGQRLERKSIYHRKDDDCIEARGFCASSFSSGLSPADYEAHVMAKREGIIDMGTTTSLTGDAQRRLCMQMINLAIAVDGTIRDETGFIYQPMYSDGFRGAEILTVTGGGRPTLSFIDLQYEAMQLNAKEY